MKKLTQRERIAVTILPAGILFLAYFLMFARPIGKETAELQRQSLVLQERQPTPQNLSETIAEHAALKKAAAALGKGSAGEGNSRGSGLWNDPEAKTRANQYLAGLISRNQLVLIEEQLVGSGGASMPQNLVRFEPLEAVSSVWQISLVGTFPQVNALLLGLENPEQPLLPLAIQMERPPGDLNPVQKWTLWMHR